MLSEKEYVSVFNAHFEAVRQYVFHRFGDAETASDIAQEVFAKIWEIRDSLSINNLIPLIYKCAINYANMNYRKRQSRMNFEQSIMCEENAELSPEDKMLFDELAGAYAKTMEQLPEKQRTVFLMSREDGMKYSEIADMLHISVKTVEKHIGATLKILRKNLL
jgi:RNA polymerase sigma-70 factor (ECF subfamily)